MDRSPLIFPAILGTPITFRPSFYAQLIILHLSLFLRVVGDLMDQFDMRRWGGFLNEAAILLFLAMTVYSIIKTRPQIVSHSAA
jgi:hypothetical protein